ncbi:MAG: pilin [Candidatus Gracilibacteria bacterium]|nr:pilin [Candidatus Gracilibacteria bacterium]MDQ7022856.1 pilin [Candidatus Gracilibacteria bacterium]
MKNIIKTTAYSAVVLATTISSLTAVDYGKDDVKRDFGGTQGTDIKATLSNILTYILGFLSIIAIGFAIYGGFQILTAGGDDDKVKKGKTTLINALIGIFVIMMAWSIVGWLLTGGETIVTGTGVVG